jgi:hypothetical protein
MSASTAGIIGLNQKPKAGAVCKRCQNERTNAVMLVTEFYDDDLNGFLTRTFACRVLCPAQSPEAAACLAEDGILPLLIGRTVLACGPFSPSSSTKLTLVPTLRWENALLRTLFLWK